MPASPVPPANRATRRKAKAIGAPVPEALTPETLSFDAVTLPEPTTPAIPEALAAPEPVAEEPIGDTGVAAAVVEAPAEVVVEATETMIEAAPAAVETLVDPIEKLIETPTPVAAAAVATQKDYVMEAMNTAATEAQTVFTKVKDGAKDAVVKGQQVVKDAADFSKGNVEAMIESSKISARGLEALAQDNVAFTKSSLETATSTMQSVAAVQSPVDLFKLQGDYMRSAFDAMVAQASKNTEAMLKLANDAAQPLSSRVALAAEKIKLAA